jgi:hypothetical protein
MAQWLKYKAWRRKPLSGEALPGENGHANICHASVGGGVSATKTENGVKKEENGYSRSHRQSAQPYMAAQQ